MTFEFKPSLDRKMELINGNMYEYEIFNLIDEYDDRLKEKTIPWDFALPLTNLKYLATSLIKTMIRNHGIGLSANQVGLPWSFFAIGGTGRYVEFVVNPKIVGFEGQIYEQEGCLSAPGLYLKVPRHAKINVEFYDLVGKKQERTYDGLSARIFQHEYDHLQGVRFQDKVSSLALERGKKDVKKNLRKLAEMKEKHRQEQLAQEKKPDEVVNTQAGVQYVIKT